MRDLKDLSLSATGNPLWPIDGQRVNKNETKQKTAMFFKV